MRLPHIFDDSRPSSSRMTSGSLAITLDISAVVCVYLLPSSSFWSSSMLIEDRTYTTCQLRWRPWCVWLPLPSCVCYCIHSIPFTSSSLILWSGLITTCSPIAECSYPQRVCAPLSLLTNIFLSLLLYIIPHKYHTSQSRHLTCFIVG